MNKIIVIQFLMLLVAILFYLIPPKKMNFLYGYRTSNSLSSDENFAFANKYAAKHFLIFTIINALINGGALIIGFVNIPFAIISTLITLFLLIYMTEKALQKK